MPFFHVTWTKEISATVEAASREEADAAAQSEIPKLDNCWDAPDWEVDMLMELKPSSSGKIKPDVRVVNGELENA